MDQLVCANFDSNKSSSAAEIAASLLVLPSQRRVGPAADDDFVECRNAYLMTVLVLSSQRRVRPAADDDFVHNSL